MFAKKDNDSSGYCEESRLSWLSEDPEYMEQYYEYLQEKKLLLQERKNMYE